MNHLPEALAAVLGLVIAVVIASIATRVQVLPEVIDVTIVLTAAGLGALAGTMYGAIRRYPSERVGRLSMFGTVVGGLAGAAFLLIYLLVEVL